jgi:hypothetical protein
MIRKMPFVVGSALAALLVLTAVQAQGPLPSVDVSKTFDAATETTASGTITICNVSDDPIDVTIETIDDNLFYKQGPGPWTWLATATVSGVAPGDVIPAASCVDGSWEATYALLEGTTALRNEVNVKLVDRDKVFVARESFEFPDLDD